MGRRDPSYNLLRDGLDLMILRSLAGAPMHGYGLAFRLGQVSDDVLQTGESAFYAALRRLPLNGCVKPDWGASEDNRGASFYSLAGQRCRRLARERQESKCTSGTIFKVLETV